MKRFLRILFAVVILLLPIGLLILVAESNKSAEKFLERCFDEMAQFFSGSDNEIN